MKILCTGDWHLTDRKPINRIDNYLESQLEKLKFIFDTYKKENCKLLIQPGDFFDRYEASDFLKFKFIDLFEKYEKLKIITLYGQHDMRFRDKDKSHTSLNLLNKNKIVKIQNEFLWKESDVNVYCVNYEEQIPEIKNDSKYNILAIHKMIVNEKLWSEQTNFVYADKFLIDNNFDLIVSGDNHQNFDLKIKNKILVNCGSLMRSSISQVDHKPCIYIIDTDNIKYKKIVIPIKKDVFDLNTKNEKEENKLLETFVEGLNDVDFKGYDFKKNLEEFYSKNKIGGKIKKIIMEVLDEC